MNTIENSENKIAVVGMSGRFPGASTLDQFWNNLRDGVEAVTRLSDEDMKGYLKNLDPLSAKYAKRQVDNPNYVKAGFFIDHAEDFDAGFFGFNPSELELIDPQHRVFLETSWEAFENAGYDPMTFDGRVGVYAGTQLSRYMLFNIFSNREILYSERDFLAGIGNEVDYLPTRVSYKLNLKGPSVSVQTACSTSLVAIHLGCQALLNGECDMALAGGSVLQVPHKQGYLFQDGSMVAPDGHCRAFDAKAQGTVFSAGGSGSILLKRLDDAIADRDHIYSVVSGSAINNDGSNKVGYTAPGVEGQIAAITEALDVAEVSPDQMSYIEAHGTGTPLGDPIEIDALSKAYRTYTDRKQYCAIGSVKTNIGHMASAAGVASVIKVSLALEQGKIPPSLNYTSPNPRIDFDASPFFVNTELADWTGVDGVRRAGVSSFGVGGTNAHLIMEQAPETATSGSSRDQHLLCLSAQTRAALDEQKQQLSDYLSAQDDVDLADLAYTLKSGRHAMQQRYACVINSREQAIEKLQGSEPALQAAGSPLTEVSTPVFMFSGQGSQYVNMAREVYDAEPLFRENVDRCSEMLKPHLGEDLVNILYPPAGEEDAATARLLQTSVTQPALFVVEYALYQLLLSWGIRPTAMIGHSVGEWVCACVAGVVSLEDALKLVARRGELMQQQASGSMLSVRLPEDEAIDLLGEDCSLAAVNGPEFCVIAGPDKAIDDIASGDLPVQKLHTSHAFHSSMMDPALAPFRDALAEVHLQAPDMRFLSNVTGTWITAEEATDPEYWVKHLRGTVRFADGIAELTRQAGAVLIEVGPGQTLASLSRLSITDEAKAVAIDCLPHPKDSGRSHAHLLQSVGKVWTAGVAPDWSAYFADEDRNRLPLPTYPFQRKRFWLDCNQDTFGNLGTLSGDKQNLDDWFYTPGWSRASAPSPASLNGRTVLLLHAGTDADRELTTALRESGANLISAECRAGTGFVEQQSPSAEVTGKHFCIDAALAEHFEQLFDATAAELQTQDNDDRPLVILHTLTMGELDDSGALTEGSVQRNTGFYSLIGLAQAIGQYLGEREIELNVIGIGLMDVIGTEQLLPELAPILGPCKVIPLEYRKVRTRLIDFSVSEKLEPSQLVSLLRSELTEPPVPIVAYRHNQRWLQTYDSLALPHENTIDPTRTTALIKPQGSYLITGGLGGLGLVHAETIAQEHPVKLSLLGRSGLPDRTEWDQLLAELPGDDPVFEKISQIRLLESMGSEVLVLTADSTDEQQMSDALERIQAEFGGLDGIVHCAGAAGGGLIQLKSKEAAERVFSAKISGTLLLEKLTAHLPLDFVMLSSSLFAVSGGVGQVDYCAANNFMDTFARAERFSQARKVISVSWDAWDEIGMARGMLSRLQGGNAEDSGEWEVLEHSVLHRRQQVSESEFRYLSRLNPEADWFLVEHRILDQATVPGTFYLEMARAAVADHAGRTRETAVEGLELSGVYFMRPMQLLAGQPRDLRLTLTADNTGFAFVVESKSGHQWETHVTGRAMIIDERPASAPDLQAIQARCNTDHRVSPPLLVAEDNGEIPFIYFGPRWQCLAEIHIGNGEVLARLDLAAEFSHDTDSYCLHPALLDVATGPTSGYAVPAEHADDDAPFLPFSYGRLIQYQNLPSTVFSHIRFQASPSPDTVSLSIDILSEGGEVLVSIEDFSLRRVNQQAMQPNADQEQSTDPQPEEQVGSASMAILPAEGARVIARILKNPQFGHIVVSTSELGALLQQLQRGSEVDEAESTADSSQGSAHARPDLATDYVEPANRTEEVLAGIWQAVLGIDRVGRDDNFFELGADSVLGVQVVAKAREQGVTLSPNQLFDHQTLAELAPVAITDWADDDRDVTAENAADDVLPDTLPLTSAATVSADHYPYFSLLLDEEINSELLLNACVALVSSVDSLGYLPGKDALKRVEDSASLVSFHEMDFSGTDDSTRNTLRDSIADGQATMAVARITSGVATQAIVMFNPLICDLYSMEYYCRWLIGVLTTTSGTTQDVTTLSHSIDADKSGYSRWVTAQHEYQEQAPEQDGASATTVRLKSQPPVAWPFDEPADAVAEPDSPPMDCLVDTLDTDLVESLMNLHGNAYQIEPWELLMVAYFKTLSEWSGVTEFSIDAIMDARNLEQPAGHWKQALGNLDVVYPVGGDIGDNVDDSDKLIRQIKELSREARSIAYTLALTRAQGPDSSGFMHSPFCLRYFAADELSKTLPHNSYFDFMPIAGGESGYALHLSVYRFDDKFQLRWRYDRRRLSASTLAGLTQQFVAHLRSAIDVCAAQSAPVYTPSDFPEAGLGQDLLDQLVGDLLQDTTDEQR